VIQALIAGLTAAVLAAPAARTITGTITDSMCERADHSAMKMGPTDAECARACNEEHDATFVLFDGKTAYALSDQRRAATFAGRKVIVTGTVDAKTHTIRVAAITSSKR
jgi:hypothetical protein